MPLKIVLVCYVSRGWALTSLIGHTLAVVAVLLITDFFKDALGMPIANTFIFAFFLGAMMATLKISYAHGGFPADSGEVVTYNLSLFFQAFGLASIISNCLTCASLKGGI